MYYEFSSNSKSLIFFQKTRCCRESPTCHFHCRCLMAVSLIVLSGRNGHWCFLYFWKYDANLFCTRINNIRLSCREEAKIMREHKIKKEFELRKSWEWSNSMDNVLLMASFCKLILAVFVKSFRKSLFNDTV